MKKTVNKISSPTTKTKAPAKAPAKAPPAPVKASPPAKKSAAPAKKKVATVSEPPATFISAKVDIGFGNHLYVRGTGPGLSWDTGLAMDCVGAGLWTVTVKDATLPITFK